MTRILTGGREQSQRRCDGRSRDQRERKGFLKAVLLALMDGRRGHKPRSAGVPWKLENARQ